MLRLREIIENKRIRVSNSNAFINKKNMKVIFSNRSYIQLLSEVYEKIQTETGGIFLGFYKDDVWYIVESIDPGPQSVFQIAYFEYDQSYVNHLINKVARIYKKNLSLLGLWHRHPGSFDVFSGTDDKTNSKYASLFHQGAISALVNIDPTFRLSVYHVSDPLCYQRIEYEVGDELFPEEILSLHGIDDYYSFINSYCDNKIESVFNLDQEFSIWKIIEDYCTKAEKIDLSQFQNELIEHGKQDEYVELILNTIDQDIEFLSNAFKLKIVLKQGLDAIVLSEYGSKNRTLNFYFIKSIDKYVINFGTLNAIYYPGVIKKWILNKYNDKNKKHIFLQLKKWLGFVE